MPLVAGLLQAGAPLDIVFSVLLTSPLISEIAVPLLVGLFGWRVTALYVDLMFTAAVLGGLVLGRPVDIERHVDRSALAAFDTQSDVPAVTDGGVETGVAAPAPGHRVRLRSAAGNAWRFFRGMLPYISLGIGAAAIAHGVVSVSWLRATLGPSNPFAVPMAVIIGITVGLTFDALPL